MIPRVSEFPDVDVMETSLPPSLSAEREHVNTATFYEFFTALPVVMFRWRRTVSLGGPIDKATVIDVTKRVVPVSLSDGRLGPSNELRELDPGFVFTEFKEAPTRLGKDLLLVLHKSVGTGTDKPKRFLSTQVVSCVKNDDGTCKPIVLSLAEAYQFLANNPGLILGVGILRSYMLLLLYIDPITPDDLKDIATNVYVSAQNFYYEYGQVLKQRAVFDVTGAGANVR